MPNNSRSKSALAAKAKVAASDLELLRKAAVWCIEKEKGGKAAVASGLFPNLKRSKIDTAVAKLRAGKALERVSNRLMTAKEESEICDWIVASAMNNKPAPLTAVSAEIVKVLKVCFLFNKSKKFSPKATTKLSKAALHAKAAHMILPHETSPMRLRF